MKRIRRKLIIMLAAVMVMGMQSVTALAEENVEDVMTETTVSTVGIEMDIKPEVETSAENSQQENNEMDVENTEEENIETDANVEAVFETYSVEDVVASGTCGDNLLWVLKEDGTMTISGTGDMWDYGYGSSISGAGTELEQERVKKVVIEEGVTSIGEEAFSFCYGLTEVCLPNGLTSIGAWAFECCNSLTKINLPEGLRVIGDGAFSECGSLVEIHLPESLTSIGGAAFSKCGSLIEITIPKGVEKIEGSTFYYCSSLKEIILPKSQTNIEAHTFSHCSSLTEVSIPEGVTSIGMEAFNACNSLKRIEFPKGLSSIDFNAFGACSALEEIYFWGDAPSMEEDRYDVFIGVTANVYYPENNSTWMEEERQKYNVYQTYGYLTWIPWNPGSRLQIVEEATDSVYVKGSSNGATIKCTEELGKFIGVAVDGVLVDSSNYTVEEGSTVLTFLSSYLDTLSVGDHVVTLNYTYGSVDTRLTVLENGTNLNTPANGTDTSGNVGNVNSGSNPKQNGSTQGGVPKTGDNVSLILWMQLMIIASCGCLVLMRMMRARK